LRISKPEKQRKKRQSHEAVEGEEYSDYEDQERLRIVQACIGKLGDVCKKILTYYYFDGLSMSDISEKLQFANTDTAKTKKYKCKKKLDTLIKENYTTSDFFD
jgi:DNA-directed RNA polymerase specialized sigma24 family protein